MQRLTDEQREQAARVWWIAEAAVRRAVRRNPGLRRYRADLLSFAGEYLVGVVSAYRSDGGASLETYVTGRVRFVVADWMRSHFGRAGQAPRKLARRFVSLSRSHGVPEWDSRPATLADALPVSGPAADAGAVRAENAERVRRLLARLNDRERRVVESVALRELTQREAAAELGYSEQWANRIYPQAIERLGGETPRMRRAARGAAV